MSESGHAPGRAFIGQDGHLNLNDASIVGSDGAALVTPSEIAELTGGGQTSLHSHAGGGPSSGIQYVDVQLNDAQIKALPTTPVELVAAPITGLVLSVWAAYFLTDLHATAYTNVQEQTSLQIYGSLDGVLQVPGAGPLLANPDTVATATARGKFLSADPLVGNDPTTPSHLTAAAFNTADGNIDSGNFTGGNAANTLSIRVWYAVVPAVPFGV